MSTPIKLCCQRCRGGAWTTLDELRTNPAPIICSDCRVYLLAHPDVAEREFQQALAVSAEDSRRMKARWAAQDAAKQKGAA